MSEPPPAGRGRAFTGGLAGFLGLRLIEPGEVRATASPELLRPTADTVTGPVTFALVDYAMGSAAWTLAEEGEAIATLSVAINYVAAGRVGEELVCRAEVDRRGRSAATLRATVVAGDEERLIATAIGAFSIFPRGG